jgi:hypothetical protein
LDEKQFSNFFSCLGLAFENVYVFGSRDLELFLKGDTGSALIQHLSSVKVFGESSELFFPIKKNFTFSLLYFKKTRSSQDKKRFSCTLFQPFGSQNLDNEVQDCQRIVRILVLASSGEPLQQGKLCDKTTSKTVVEVSGLKHEKWPAQFIGASCQNEGQTSCAIMRIALSLAYDKGAVKLEQVSQFLKENWLARSLQIWREKWRSDKSKYLLPWKSNSCYLDVILVAFHQLEGLRRWIFESCKKRGCKELLGFKSVLEYMQLLEDSTSSINGELPTGVKVNDKNFVKLAHNLKKKVVGDVDLLEKGKSFESTQETPLGVLTALSLLFSTTDAFPLSSFTREYDCKHSQGQDMLDCGYFQVPASTNREEDIWNYKEECLECKKNSSVNVKIKEIKEFVVLSFQSSNETQFHRKIPQQLLLLGTTAEKQKLSLRFEAKIAIELFNNHYTCSWRSENIDDIGKHVHYDGMNIPHAKVFPGFNWRMSQAPIVIYQLCKDEIEL